MSRPEKEFHHASFAKLHKPKGLSASHPAHARYMGHNKRVIRGFIPYCYHGFKQMLQAGTGHNHLILKLGPETALPIPELRRRKREKGRAEQATAISSK